MEFSSKQLELTNRLMLDTLNTIAKELGISTERKDGDELIAEIIKLKRINEIQRSVLSRMPLCSAHRDKVSGRLCLMCEIEELRNKKR